MTRGSTRSKQSSAFSERAPSLPKIWFCVPAHGRVELTRVCLRQLVRTCESLAEGGVQASAVVIADDENLEAAADLGFGTIESSAPLGSKFNDGMQFASMNGVTHVVPFGSDNFIDHRILRDLRDDEIRCFRHGAMVSEDGKRLAHLKVRFPGGLGVRVIPTEVLEGCGFRPAEEDIGRGIDASTLRGIKRGNRRPPKLVYFDSHPLSIVDWKSSENLNSYRGYLRFRDGAESTTPFDDLADVYPGEALDEMRAVYGVRRAVAA